MKCFLILTQFAYINFEQVHFKSSKITTMQQRIDIFYLNFFLEEFVSLVIFLPLGNY
jgi:hypothetical protein